MSALGTYIDIDSDNMLQLANRMILTEIDYDLCNCPSKFFSLLPLSDLRSYKAKIFQNRLPFFIKTGLWRIFLGLYKIHLKRRQLPKTMEISCLRPCKKDMFHLLELHKGAYCAIGSMLSYTQVLLQIGYCLERTKKQICFFVPKAIFNDVKQRIQSNRIYLFALEDFFSESIFEKYTGMLEKASNNWSIIKARLHEGNNCLLKDLISIAPEQLQYISIEVLPQYKIYSEIAKQIFKKLEPASLIAVRLRRLTETVFTETAHNQGIPVVIANHGHIGKDWDAETLGGVDQVSSALLVWNHDQKKVWQYLFPGLPENQIHIVGGIQWDEPIKRFLLRNEERKKIKEKLAVELGWVEKKDCERWLTITIDGFMRTNLDRLLKKNDGLSGLGVIIKARPHESSEDYKDILKHNYSFPIVVVSKDTPIDFFELLFASDLVMTCISTTNLDALSVGTPVMTLVTGKTVQKDDRLLGLDKYGLPVVTSLVEMRTLLKKWLKDNELKKAWDEAADRSARELIANYPKADAGENIIDIFESLSRSII